MNKIKFNYMPVQQQIEYVNNLLKFDSLKEASKIVEVGAKTLKERFKQAGYVYNAENKKFEFDDNSVTSVIISENTEIIGDADILKSNIIELATDYNEIKDMLEWYRNGAVSKSNIIEVVDGIKIQLPEDDNPNFRTTIRVNSKVYEMFSEFTKENKEFTAKDLLSQALYDYLMKYK